MLTKKIWICTCLTLLLAFNATAKNNSKNKADEKLIYGWLEWVNLKDQGISAKAKLDTGAKTSSLHAKNIEEFERDGKEWVRFQFASDTKLKDQYFKKNASKKVVSIEAPLYRNVQIKQHTRSNVKRPVIILPFKMGTKTFKAQFTLTDRKKFLYPVLLGRRFLEEAAIVDSSTKYLQTQPGCDTTAAHDKNSD